jgi:hypothetical protein
MAVVMKATGILAAAVVFFLSSAPAWAGAKDLKVKLDDLQHSGYFDAHTHWPGGILPYKAFAKMLDEYQTDTDLALPDKAKPTQEDYARLTEMYEALFNKIKALLKTGELKASPRVSPASRAVADAAIPSGATKAAKLQFLETALNRLLTSSVRTSFDSAFAIRGALMDAYAKDDARKAKLLDWLMLETARGDITYSEQSASGNAITRDFTPKLMADSLARIKGQLGGKPTPDLRFLIQFSTAMLSQVGEASADQWQIATARGPETVSANGAVRANDELMTALASGNALAQDNVSGVDILTPERNSFTDKGKANLKQLITIVFKKAIALQKRMLVHVHCGEGFPIAEDDHGTGVDSLEKPVPAVVMAADGKTPLHYQNASQNIEKVLEAVAELRKDSTIPRINELDNYVVIRLGHVAHATRAQAKRMFELNLWADINLTSNIATGALYLDRPDLTKPNVLMYFKDHALVSLMAEGVSVVFGTDGPGVEHSAMALEPAIALDIFAQLGSVKDKRDQPMAGKSKQYVDEMLRLGTAHVKFMNARPSPPPASK